MPNTLEIGELSFRECSFSYRVNRHKTAYTLEKTTPMKLAPNVSLSGMREGMVTDFS